MTSVNLTSADIDEHWDLQLENMPGFVKAMQRIYAWFEGEILDRPLVRFSAHNAFVGDARAEYAGGDLRARWFDAEFQVENYLRSIEGKTFHAETFPVFFPNLGPEVYSAFYGSHLEYGDETSWSVPLLHDWDDVEKLQLDMENNPYVKGLEALTRCALERCEGKFMVGYTDLHPGVDCVAAWRDPQQLCFDMIECPEEVEALIELAIRDFDSIYTHFDNMLKVAGQLSVTWMGIPSFGRMHIPSCDFSSLISPAFFDRFCLPVLEREVIGMTHNVFHVDGRGVAKNLDRIFEVPEVHAIQWVQGVGNDEPIMQWVPLIKRIQERLPVIVDLKVHELEPFMNEVSPEGIFLWVATESEEQELDILKRVEKWTRAGA